MTVLSRKQKRNELFIKNPLRFTPLDFVFEFDFDCRFPDLPLKILPIPFVNQNQIPAILYLNC